MGHISNNICTKIQFLAPMGLKGGSGSNKIEPKLSFPIFNDALSNLTQMGSVKSVHAKPTCI